ncbi:hypothetical protein JIN77_00420 [Verrucomicrobiaceae bacterium R5-34]|uniref:Uncharacterized protein n=1 Tax=Oceaniferula flava TaxID=2800421 RepID=A0AAE2S8P6_9BACT|nr:hypothetical protein [Oceaniferula flavus]MBK1829176.1 hypothetical protein [Verrucomicrobiaceae bacterium R5-34]MBK1853413.1 hypothetical protein [Oceaniferula flavus]MBM1134718.1 hypothetical protein [Oceaniferula flavus]
MKAILYVLAIVAIAAGAWFSYDSMSKFQTLKTEREELDSQNEARKSSIKKTKKEADTMVQERDNAKKALAEAIANRDNAVSNEKLAKKEAASWSSKIAGQKEKITEVESVIAKIKKEFSKLGEDIELDQVPGLVQKLEDDLKQANKTLEELETNVEVAQKRVASSQESIQNLNSRITKRARRISGNSAQGSITAVNHDWGFVTVSVPSNMPVDATSKLTIKRGASFIGTLKINAVEGSRIIADIDYKSMSPGMVVQPGDQVVLTKPVTN